MAVILNKLPFYDRDTTIQVQSREYVILARQIIVWVSLTSETVREFGARTPRFPAVLDPGFNDNFLIYQEQLQRFAGLQPRHLVRSKRMLRASGRLIPVYLAKIWLHRNQPGERDKFADFVPFPLQLHTGIGVCSDPDGYPRLPLLGARALRQHRLHVTIDYEKCRVSMRTPRRFWFFG